MDNTSELSIVFSSLPHPARHNILTQLTPEKAIGLCNSNSTNRKLCKEDFDVWINRINNECREYREVGENITANNSYDKYVECKRERNKLSNLSRAQRMDLINQGDLINFIRSNPEKNLGYFQIAVFDGHLHIAKWLQSKFNFTKEEAKFGFNLLFTWTCEHGFLDMVKWFSSTFDITNEEARAGNNRAFILACENKHYHVTRWLDQTFDLRLTPKQRNECL